MQDDIICANILSQLVIARNEIKMWDARADEVKMQRNVILPPKRGRVALVGQHTENIGEPNKVYLE